MTWSALTTDVLGSAIKARKSEIRCKELQERSKLLLFTDYGLS